MDNLIESLDYRLRRIDNLRGKESNLKVNLSNLERELDIKQGDLKVIQESASYYKKSQDIIYEKSIGALKELINKALSFVFYDKNYEIIINLEDKRGTKTLSFGLKDLDKDLEVSLKNGCGNGVRAVISAVLNLFVLISKGSKILILDEKYSCVSADYIERFYMFLSKLCVEKSLRIVLITHDPRFISFSDKGYTVIDGRIESTDV
jgi:DNA repair exonuclease SbcCD ATPase subunit